MSRRHRAIKPGYVWGALCNTEPPDDEPEAADEDDFDIPEFDPDAATEAAGNRWERDRDARAQR